MGFLQEEMEWELCVNKTVHTCHINTEIRMAHKVAFLVVLGMNTDIPLCVYNVHNAFHIPQPRCLPGIEQTSEEETSVNVVIGSFDGSQR